MMTASVILMFAEAVMMEVKMMVVMNDLVETNTGLVLMALMFLRVWASTWRWLLPPYWQKQDATLDHTIVVVEVSVCGYM